MDNIFTGKPELDEALLIHFGVKGMRWGVRRKRKSSGSKGQKKSSTKDKIFGFYGATKQKSGKYKVTDRGKNLFASLATAWAVRSVARMAKTSVVKLAYDPGTKGAFVRGLAWVTGRVVKNNPL